LQQRPALNIEKIQNNPQVYTQKKKPFSGKLVLQGKRTRKKLEKCSITGIELQNIAWNQAGKPMNPQKIDLCLLCGKKEK
jgi:ribosomal protein L34E